MGISQAAEWCYSGRVFPADEALAGGLVRSVHAADELLPAARAIASEISENAAPVSVALTRQMLWRMLGAEHPMIAHRAALDHIGAIAAVDGLDPFFIGRGDLTAALGAHKSTGARVTLALSPVEDTSGYGVVPIAADGQVEAGTAGQ